jgi:hypothetical protein
VASPELPILTGHYQTINAEPYSKSQLSPLQRLGGWDYAFQWRNNMRRDSKHNSPLSRGRARTTHIQLLQIPQTTVNNVETIRASRAAEVTLL